MNFLRIDSPPRRLSQLMRGILVFLLPAALAAFADAEESTIPAPAGTTYETVSSGAVSLTVAVSDFSTIPDTPAPAVYWEAAANRAYSSSIVSIVKEPSTVKDIRQRLLLTRNGLLGKYISSQAVAAQLEANRLAARAPMQTFVVTLANDTTDSDINDNIYSPPTLRAAIQNANKTPEVDQIIFAVSGVSVGALGSMVVSQPVIIDGTFGGGAVVISNGASPQGAIWVAAGGCVVKNLEFTGFTGNGSCLALLANGGLANTVQGCVFRNNGITSINFNASSNNIIGGLGPGERNIIYGQSGNPSGAISLILSSHSNRIIGNYIGTPDGITIGGNSRNGVYDESNGNYIAYNVIGGNDWHGVSRDDPTGDTARGQVVEYNKLGVTEDGLSALPNGATTVGDGYRSSGFRLAQDTIRHNVISGNYGNGMYCSSVGGLIEFNICGMDINMTADLGNGGLGINSRYRVLIQDNFVSGNNSGIQVQSGGIARANLVGADEVSRVSFGNTFTGITVNDTGCIVGGDISGYGNIISGNGGDGIWLYGRFSKNNRILNNKIGVDYSGNVAVPNGGSGIRMQYAPDSTIISRNIIAANGNHGIWMSSQTVTGNLFRPDGNLIYANHIGLGADGQTVIPNIANGILVEGGGYNIFGHPTLDSGNVIVGNTQSGISMADARKNKFLNNYIGVTKSLVDAGNQGHGIVMVNSDSNEIGGIQGFVGNVIAGNDSAGIALYGSGSRANLIAANSVGVVSDTLQPPIGNLSGIYIDGGRSNRIGYKFAEVPNDIAGNRESGIFITGDSNAVVKNTIRLSVNEPSAFDGEGEGIVIAGVGNRIGGSFPTETNTIMMNKGAGVLVNSGTGNTIRGNLIYDNDRLGIDLIPDFHVTKNDSADQDNGANELQNYPVIDSALVFNGQSTLYGHVESSDDTAAIMVEFFKTTECDTSKYGEGDTFIDSLPAYVVFGRADFVKTFNEEFDSVKKLTMTATNSRGSTSEFSACWPAKVLEITDYLGDNLPERNFTFLKMSNDIPTLTEDSLGEYSTDNLGLVYLGQEFVDNVDSLKIIKLLHEQPNPKRATILPIAYRVWLDNGDFDTTSYNLFFTELDSNYLQRVKLQHTTVKYNLLTSIEWDASRAYIDSLKQMFRSVSNLLYDIGDGQLCLDSVMIVDEKVAWTTCDVRLFASNNQWPQAHVGGLVLPDLWAKTSFPRQQETDRASNRYVSSIYDPPIPNRPNMFRTITHELGHYAMGFRDEYKYPPPDTVKCGAINNYGFMQDHYPGSEPQASEMSWFAQYTLAACRNTAQYVSNFGSCWTFLESKIEKRYDNIWAPICPPSDRGVSYLPESYFSGPNDAGVPVNYDVGSRVGFRETIPPQIGRNRLIRAADAGTNQPKGGLQIMHYRKSAGYLIGQGLTYDDGRLVLLGVQEGDAVFVVGPGYIISPNPPQPPPPPKATWSIGTFQAGDTSFIPIVPSDTLPARRVFPFTPRAEEEPLDIATIDSIVPVICDGNISAGTFSLEIQAQTPLGGTPTLQMHTDNNGVFGYATTANGSTYSATISDDPADAGTFYLWLPDPEIDSFFFTLDYAIAQFSDTVASVDFTGKSGDAEIDLNFNFGGVTRALIMSTDFPVPYDGLSGALLPASRAHTVATHPSSVYNLGSTMAITYDLGLAAFGANVDIDPATLSIYRWDKIAKLWNEIGGRADTAQSIITAAISQPGVYAVFANAVVAGAPCGDVDASGRIDISDAVYMINYIFASGPVPLDSAGGDMDCSSRVDITDAVYLVNYIFAGGPQPCAACQ